MNYPLWICLKYMSAKRRQRAISAVTVLSILGVSVGVMALIVVISVMSGFTEELKQKILGMTPHVMVFQRGREMKRYEQVREQLLKIPGVVAASPFIIREIILQGPHQSVAAVVRAIDPQTVESVVPLTRILKAGDITSLGPRGDGNFPGILVGKRLLGELGCQVGDTVVMISPETLLTPWGNLPRWRKFQVRGYFDSGHWEFDSKLAYISMVVAQDFFGTEGRASGVEVRTSDAYRAGEVRERIQASPLGRDYFAQDWMQMNRNLMIALGMQKKVLFVILVCIVGVAALLIISILAMMAMEKRKDIAILRAMGARSSAIMRIFLYQGLIIGAIGTSLGCAIGLLISWNLEWIVRSIERALDVRFLPEDVYYIGELTARVDPMDVGIILGVTLLISLGASLFPSWRAARLDPVEGLRYE